jgi:hypothetical protein
MIVRGSPAGKLQRSCQRLVRELPASGKHVEILCRLVEAGCTPSIGSGNLDGHIVGIDTADKMTDPQIVAKVREHFLNRSVSTSSN